MPRGYKRKEAHRGIQLTRPQANSLSNDSSIRQRCGVHDVGSIGPNQGGETAGILDGSGLFLVSPVSRMWVFRGEVLMEFMNTVLVPYAHQGFVRVLFAKRSLGTWGRPWHTPLRSLTSFYRFQRVSHFCVCEDFIFMPIPCWV